MTTETKTAEQRGQEMLDMKIKDLPPLAYRFMRKLAGEVGLSIEVCLTAYTVYAQCVEGLPCTDDLYLARPQDAEWFKEQAEATA